MTCDEVKPLLNARMDNEIDAIRRAALDSHLETCSSCAAELENLAGVAYAIHTDMTYYKAPADLRNQVRLALRGAEYFDGGSRTTGWKAWGAIAAGLVICAMAAAPFMVNARNQRQLIAEELLSAHQRALSGRSVDVISSDQHTVKPWFNGKLPFSPPVTDLAADGFPLEGGRVDFADEHPVAALVYSRRLHRIDVFVWPSPGKAAPARFERNGYEEISWEKDGFLFTVVSDLNDAELAGFADLLRRR
jgi:anti-sigma factor RsiW